LGRRERRGVGRGHDDERGRGEEESEWRTNLHGEGGSRTAARPCCCSRDRTPRPARRSLVRGGPPAPEPVEHYPAHLRIEVALVQSAGQLDSHAQLLHVPGARPARRDVLLEPPPVVLREGILEVVGYELHELDAHHLVAGGRGHIHSSPISYESVTRL